MIKKEWCSFVGSDCHNDTVRPPDVHLAYQVLKKKIPAAKYETVFGILQYARRLVGVACMKLLVVSDTHGRYGRSPRIS